MVPLALAASVLSMKKIANVGILVGLSIAFSILGYLINILLQNRKWYSKVIQALNGHESWQALLVSSRTEQRCGRTPRSTEDAALPSHSTLGSRSPTPWVAARPRGDIEPLIAKRSGLKRNSSSYSFESTKDFYGDGDIRGRLLEFA
jgi:hypothetical protein